MIQFTSAVAVHPVSQLPAALAWYSALLGREPDVVPADDTVEWEVAPNAWLHVSTSDRPGAASTILGVPSLDDALTHCAAAGLAVGEVEDYGVVRMVTLLDPDGNQVLLAQEVE